MRRIVIDASASLKWVFEDEEDTNLAMNILNDIATENLGIISPSIWLYEVANGIRSAILRKRISFLKGKKLLSAILKVVPELIDFSLVVTKTFEVANKYEISVYDASYIVVANEEKVDFYTGDKNLYKKSISLQSVKLISQYKSS